MVEAIHQHGGRNYSIFLDQETDVLYGYIEIGDEALWAALADTPINRKWWDFMADIMVTNPDNSPVSVDLLPEFIELRGGGIAVLQLGIRLHDAEKLPLDRLLPTLRVQGLTCYHLALSKSFPETPCTPGALPPGYASYLKREFAKGGVDIAVLGNYLNLLHPDDDYIDWATKMYCAHIRFASLLGCTVVATETGAPNRKYAPCPECREGKTLSHFIQRLKPVVRCAERFGVMHLKDYRHTEDGKGLITVGVPAGMGEMDYGPIMRYIKREKPYLLATLEDTKPENAAWCAVAMRKAYEEA